MRKQTIAANSCFSQLFPSIGETDRKALWNRPGCRFQGTYFPYAARCWIGSGYVVERKAESFAGVYKRETKDEENEEITIHVIGEVKYPGIVILKSGQRIVDAIEAAGGETEEADLNKLNLAQLLNDGDKIYVPNKSDEIEDNKDTTGKSSTVNLNTATLEELTSLPGIGESTAQKIIDYRKQNGKFKVIEDLKNVSGIGESKFDNIKDKITVR